MVAMNAHTVLIAEYAHSFCRCVIPYGSYGNPGWATHWLTVTVGTTQESSAINQILVRSATYNCAKVVFAWLWYFQDCVAMYPLQIILSILQNINCAHSTMLYSNWYRFFCFCCSDKSCHRTWPRSSSRYKSLWPVPKQWWLSSHFQREKKVQEEIEKERYCFRWEAVIPALDFCPHCAQIYPHGDLSPFSSRINNDGGR